MKRKIILNGLFFVVSVFFVFQFTVFGVFGQTRDSGFEDARKKLRENNFQQGVKQYYKSFLSTEHSGSIESRKADLKPAKNYFVKIAEGNPKDPKAQLYLSIIFRVVQMMPPANKLIDRLYREHPDVPILMFIKGEYLLWQDSKNEAVEVLSKLKAHPKGEKLWKFSEQLQKRYGVNVEAENRRKALVKKGFRHLDLLERKDAEETFRTILKEFPDDLDTSKAMVELLVEEGRLADAETLLNGFKKRATKSPEIPFIEVRLRYRQSRYSEVIDLVKPLLSKDPQNEYLKNLLAESLFQTSGYLEAAKYYEDLYKGDNANLGFIDRLVSCWEASGQIQKAQDLLAELTEKDEKNSFLQMELAGILERKGDFIQAQRGYQKVADSNGPFKLMAAQKIAMYKEAVEKGGPLDISKVPGNLPPPPKPWSDAPQWASPSTPVTKPVETIAKQAIQSEIVKKNQAELLKKLNRLYD